MGESSGSASGRYLEIETIIAKRLLQLLDPPPDQRSGVGRTGNIEIRAKMIVGSTGGVTERNMAINVSEEIARKDQELREMTRDLDLLKVDIDVIATVIRFRGASAPTGTQGEDEIEGDPGLEGA